MKVFAFVPTNSLKKGYENLLLKYRNQDAFMDLLKIWFLGAVMFLSLFVYLRFVSLSSTHGYFLRQENQNLNNIAFQQEVFKTQLLEQKQKNWTNLNSSRSIKKTVVTVDTQIVNVPAMTELSKN